MRRIAPTLLYFAVLAGCQPVTTELTEEQEAAIAAEVIGRADEMNRVFLAGDLDTWQTFFADDVRWGSSAGFATIDQIMSLMRAGMSTVAEVTTGVDERHVRVLGPDAAVVGLRSHGTYVLENGESIDEQSVSVAVWARVDGTWKVVYGQHSPFTGTM